MKKNGAAALVCPIGAAVPLFTDVKPGPEAKHYDCPGYSPDVGVLMGCPRGVKLAICCPTCNDTGKTTAGKLRALGERFRGKEKT